MDKDFLFRRNVISGSSEPGLDGKGGVEDRREDILSVFSESKIFGGDENEEVR